MRGQAGGVEPAARPAQSWLAPAVVSLIGLLSLLLPLIVARHFGAMGIPRGDDWSYLETLFRFSNHGTLDGNHWMSMTLVGQLVVALPVVRIFGNDISAVQVLVAVAGFGGLMATLNLSVRLVGFGSAAVAVIALGSSPMWGPLSVSYMSDVPAFTATMAALALARRALASESPSRSFVVAALAMGVFAFSIRQYAIVVVLTIGITAVWSAGSDRRVRTALIAAGVGALFVCGVIYVGWSQIPNLKSYVPGVPDGHSVSVVVVKGGGFFRLVGLVLAPAVVLAGPVAIVRRAWRTSKLAATIAGPALGLGLAVLSFRVPGQQFVGNYVDANGALSSDALLGRRPDLFPAGMYPVLVAVATLSSLVIALSVLPSAVKLIDRIRRRDFALTNPVITCLALTVGGYLLAYLFAMMTGVSVYDRYALPVIPLIGILVLYGARGAVAAGDPASDRRPSRLRWGVAGIVLIGVVLVGLVFTIDSASFDGTRWKVASAATHRGYARRQINGGFEWVNFYRGTHRPRIVVGAKIGHRSKVGGVAPVSEFCVSVVVDPKADDRPVILERAYTSPLHAAGRIVALKNRCRDAVTP